jgi:hypothetical protein
VFPNLIWLGLAQVFFGFFQFLGHRIVMNVTGRTLYNPGLAAVIFLHVPIGVYYINFVTKRGLVTGMDYVWGVAALIISIALIVVLPVQLLKDRRTPYAFSPEEVSRFNIVGKLKAKGLSCCEGSAAEAVLRPLQAMGQGQESSGAGGTARGRGKWR